MLREQCVSLDVDGSTVVPVLSRGSFHGVKDECSSIVDEHVDRAAELLAHRCCNFLAIFFATNVTLDPGWSIEIVEIMKESHS